VKFLCDLCKAKYQIPDERVAGKTVRMKCRKCEHMIEVRAAVTETSIDPSKAAREAAESALAAKAPAKTAPRIAPAPRRPVEEWYASIDGATQGPLGMAELRRKAAAGALTEETLVWRDGLDEWQPVKAILALAVMVREAKASRRTVTRATEGSPLGSPGTSAASSSPGGGRRPLPSPAMRGESMAATARLATAEKLDLAPLAPPIVEAAPAPQPVPVPAPAPPAPVVSEIAPPAPQPAPAPIVVRTKGPPPLLAIGVVLGLAAFGAVGGYAFFFPPAQPQAPAAPAETIYITVPAPPAATTPAAPPTTAAPTTPKASPRPVARPAPSAAAPAEKPVDVGSVMGLPPPLPTIDGPQLGVPRATASSSSLSQPQIESVQRTHLLGLKRACVERSASGATNVNVQLHVTVGANGQVVSTQATGNDPATVTCVETNVKRWQFPQSGGQSVFDMPFHFVRQ
jgi:predicted Zn finger-like uncharacterized protein